MSRLNAPRPPSYVSRETGAAELDISTDTWDEMVKNGRLPKPIKVGTAGTTPRWRWEDVDAVLSGRRPITPECEPEPFFRGLANGTQKDRGRAAS